MGVEPTIQCTSPLLGRGMDIIRANPELHGRITLQLCLLLGEDFLSVELFYSDLLQNQTSE